MAPELTYLTWSVVLLIVHVVVQATGYIAANGLGYALGPQDEQRQPDSLVLRRVNRALWNYLQTWPAFIALALALVVSARADAFSALGAALWFWARVAYVPVYAAGFSTVRTLVWFTSVLGLLMMLWPMLTG